MKRLFAPKAVALASLVAATALLFESCGEEDSTTPPGRYELTEPKYVLASVELSFNRGDAELLDKCLSDDFVFLFDADDVGKKVNGYVIPASWNRRQLLRAARNMFARAHGVTLENGWREIGSPEMGETTYNAANVPLKLTVMLDAVNGYHLSGAKCNYGFIKNAGARWRLSRWRDLSRECGGCVGEWSLGSVLARYYP